MSLPKWLPYLFLLTACSKPVGTGNFRFLSFIIRDLPPSRADAEAAEKGTKKLESFVDDWLASNEHKQRVRRFFNDLFGVRAAIPFVVEDSFRLQTTSDGVYYLTVKGTCSAAAAVSAEAWWLESGETIRICPSSTSSLIKFPSDPDIVRCADLGSLGIEHASCGCGPKQILCYPESIYERLVRAIRNEFSSRALYVYENSLSWDDLLAGNFFYGNRILYHYYFYTQKLQPDSEMLTDAELNALAALSVTADSRTDFPSGTERAGLVTAPGFMKQFNNFRSRVRALTQRLLCDDVSGALNTGNISSFLNSDLGPNNIAHGSKVSCSVCHYPMDNLASTILNWDDSGFYQSYLNYSQSGHAFGINGNGPRFLVQSYLSRGPGFHECMAKQIWQDFSGEVWDALESETKNSFIQASSGGPRNLIATVLKSTAIKKLRK